MCFLRAQLANPGVHEGREKGCLTVRRTTVRRVEHGDKITCKTVRRTVRRRHAGAHGTVRRNTVRRSKRGVAGMTVRQSTVRRKHAGAHGTPLPFTNAGTMSCTRRNIVLKSLKQAGSDALLWPFSLP